MSPASRSCGWMHSPEKDTGTQATVPRGKAANKVTSSHSSRDNQNCCHTESFQEFVTVIFQKDKLGNVQKCDLFLSST